MNELSKSIAGLLDSFNPALQKISETFCISVDYVRENAMHYILEYGRYCAYTNAADTLIFLFAICIVISIIIFVITLICMCEANLEDDKFNKITNKTIKILITFIVITPIIRTIFSLIPYWVSPEIYSIKEVLELMKGM